MDRNGRFAKVLSGVALIGLLSLFVVQEAGAATDVYLVRPQANTNNNSYNYVSQSFVAVCDSVTKIAMFLGQKSGSSNYQMEIDSAGIAKGGVLTLSAAGADDYAENEATYGTSVPVKRGYTYTLKFSRQSAMETVDFYYRPDSTYAWGRIESPGTVTGDLCARVIGVNRLPQTFWGVNASIANSCGWVTPAKRDSVMAKLDSAGIKLDREQIPWYKVQGDNGNTNTYSWDSTDHAVAASARRDMPMLFNHFGFTPRWASSWDSVSYDTNSARWRSAPPRNLDADTAGGTNYFYNYMKKLARRYGPNGVFWDSTSLGDSLKRLENHYHPVRDWEINNEVNLLFYWDLWWQYHYYTGYSYDSPGRAKLYWKACQLAWAAIKGVDSGARIYTNAVTNLQETGNSPSGKDWLRYFYDEAQSQGQNYTDVLTYHFYSSKYIHRFYPSTFEADYDTVREIMKQKGDTLRPVWADEGGWGTSSVYTSDSNNVSRNKQADVLVQLYNTGISQLINPRGPLGNVSWFSGFDWGKQTDVTGKTSGILEFPPDSVRNKASGWAYKQMTGKLKNLYFNNRVVRPDPKVYCYEFQIPGPDTALRTWCLWRSDSLQRAETLSIRTNVSWLVRRHHGGDIDSISLDALTDGRVPIPEARMDSIPRYLHEVGQVSRPDVVVDTVWLVKASGTGEPRAGEGIRFYARIRNIGNAALDSTIADTVSFYVDGVRKAKHGARRGLGTPGSGTDTLTVGYFGVGPAPDWTATWGDHLIRAWADSADRYVELREDNNTKYLWKHFQPKVSVIINSDSTFTNHLANNKLHVEMDGNTSPLPDSAKLLHEGSWIRLGVYGTRDTLVTFNGNGVKYDSVIVFQGADRDTSWDSIIVDASAPFVDITLPTPNQTVSGNVPFWGYSYDYEYHDSLWQIYVNGSPWVEGYSSVGNAWLGMPGQFGTWNSRTVPNGWWWHQLRSTDAATNLAKDSVRVRVRNNQTNGGDGWASNFGTLPSAPMNVATDPGGNVYFAETQNSKIRKYSPRKDSLFAFSAKRGNDSTGLNWAVSMILKDSTTIYIADGYAHCIKRFDRQGNLLLRFGSFGSDTSHFKQPCGVALDHRGRLFVVDRLNHRVQVFSDSTGHFLFQFGSQGTDSGRFNSPTGITITPNGQVFVSDTRNNQLQVFDSLGHYLKTIKAVDSLGLDTPLGICSDRYGDIFIADALHNRIVELNPYGERIFDFGGLGDSLWQFRTPVGVASSPGAHYLYVADAGNRRVQKFIVIEEDTTGGGPQGGAGVQVLPMVYELGPAIPNPTNGATTIRYSLPKESVVSMNIYNVTGQVVKEFNQGKQKAGYYSITWDGRSNLGHRVGAGVYFYRLQAGNWAKTRKMIVIR